MSSACQSRLSTVKAVVRNAGSDTMVNAAQAWAEEYASVRPTVSVEVAGGGSATGIVALIDGAAELANCSRLVQAEEIAAARRRTGKTPKEYIVGYDALAVYVHRDNPLQEISLEQLGQVFGRVGQIGTWTGLGIEVPDVRTQEIILISRQSNSGTYHYFRRAILGPKGDFRLGTRDLSGSKEVVSLIGGTRGAIGFSGMAYAINEVKTVRISRGHGTKAYAPTEENVVGGLYPITRPLYVYTLGEPIGETAHYLNWVLSKDGQRVVRETGYIPVFAKAEQGSKAQ